MRLSGLAIKEATGGAWLGETPAMIGDIVTDTRRFKAGQSFLALRGPNFDGHCFARDIADQALALIGDKQGVRLWKGLENYQLQVDDTLRALGDIARAWRHQLAHTVIIAITGSYGKTSLRSLLEHGLRGLGLRVSATRANLNNLIGVPQTLMAVPEDADFAVVECGISEIGEMRRMAAIVQPDIAVLTGLGVAHAEGLGGLRGVAREKALLLNEARAWCALGEGVAEILHACAIPYPQDALVAGHAPAVRWRLDGERLSLEHEEGVAELRLALPARHWAANMALAAGILLRAARGKGMAVSLESIARILAGWQPEEGRLRRRRGRAGCLLLDDSYNANPASMQAALDTLAAMPGKRVAILGDMAELGEDSARLHARLNADGIDQLYLIGEQMRYLADRYPDARWFADVEEAIAFFGVYRPERDEVILIKASRMMRLERITAILAVDAKEVGHAL